MICDFVFEVAVTIVVVVVVVVVVYVVVRIWEAWPPLDIPSKKKKKKKRFLLHQQKDDMGRKAPSPKKACDMAPSIRFWRGLSD